MYGLPTKLPRVDTPGAGTVRRSWRAFVGPGLLVSVGYMDPGNWATDIEAGSGYGYGLLFVVAAASLAGMFLQTLCARLGLVTGRDLAQLCSDRLGRATNAFLWIGAEIAIVACDIAEVLGGALGWHLLFGVPVTSGIGLTVLTTLIMLWAQGTGMSRIETIVCGLVLTIAMCFTAELCWVSPDWLHVAAGLVPGRIDFADKHALYLAIGILGATVMPHNLYLHSSAVQEQRDQSADARGRVGMVRAVRLGTMATVASLTLAFLVNAAILILAGTVFFRAGAPGVGGIEEAYHLIEPIAGSTLAAALFALALIASGQCSTLTGTLAGQVILDGFLGIRIAVWKRRLLTRVLALAPAYLGIWWLGDGGVGKLLVLSQVVLGFQLPFAMAPLLRFSSNPALMGTFALGQFGKCVGWALLSVITLANTWLAFTLL
jgi:manganese transport protein